MKRIIFILIVLIFTSCDETYEPQYVEETEYEPHFRFESVKFPEFFEESFRDSVILLDVAEYGANRIIC